jgi:hypothetical protein
MEGKLGRLAWQVFEEDLATAIKHLAIATQMF